MGLADRGGADRAGLDVGEDLEGVASELLAHELDEPRVRDRRQAVEEVRELARDRVGQQVLAQREELAELDVGRPHLLEAAAQLRREGEVDESRVDEVPREAVDEPFGSVAQAAPFELGDRALARREPAGEEPEGLFVGREQPADVALTARLDVDLVLLRRGVEERRRLVVFDGSGSGVGRHGARAMPRSRRGGSAPAAYGRASRGRPVQW